MTANHQCDCATGSARLCLCTLETGFDKEEIIRPACLSFKNNHFTFPFTLLINIPLKFPLTQQQHPSIDALIKGCLYVTMAKPDSNTTMNVLC